MRPNMAMYSINHSTVGRSTHAAGTAGAHASYITRAGACCLVVGEHMPLAKPGTNGGATRAWLDAQEAKDRKNARVIDKLRLCLPIELDGDQRRALIETFASELTGGRAPWMAALHEKGKDASNPHAHMILRDRDIETGKRALGMSDKGSTERVRQLWEKIANAALAAAGSEERIDRRTLRAQKAEKEKLAQEWRDRDAAVADAYKAEAATLERKPAPSPGPAPRAIEARGKRSQVMRRVHRVEAGPLSRRFARSLGLDRTPAPPTPEDTRRAARVRRAALRAFQARQKPQRPVEAKRTARRGEDAMEQVLGVLRDRRARGADRRPSGDVGKTGNEEFFEALDRRFGQVGSTSRKDASAQDPRKKPPAPPERPKAMRPPAAEETPRNDPEAARMTAELLARARQDETERARRKNTPTPNEQKPSVSTASQTQHAPPPAPEEVRRNDPETVRMAAKLLARARQDESFAGIARLNGLNLDRPDDEIINDPYWLQRDPWRLADITQLQSLQEAARRLDKDRQAELEKQERQKRQEALDVFTRDLESFADRLPTPRNPSRSTLFRLLEPNAMRKFFRNRHQFEATREELRSFITVTLKRWVERIAAELDALKPMSHIHDIWRALTGGNAEAADMLERSLRDRPDLAEPLKPAFEQRPGAARAPDAEQEQAPEPEQEQTPQDRPRRAGDRPVPASERD